MWAPICNWLFANYPVIIIIGVVIFFTWKAFTIYHRFTKTESDLEAHLSDFKEIKSNTISIKDKLNQLLIYLQSKDSKLKGLIQSHSPMQLTDFALKLLQEYGGKDFIEKHKIMLLKNIKDSNPKTSLDVQNAAINAISLQNDKETFNYIKDKIYNSPVVVNDDREEIQLDISTLNFIMGIELRNEYLKTNPNIIIED